MPEKLTLDTPGKMLKVIRETITRTGQNLWDNARFVMADVSLDARESRRILPLGMWPSNPPTATLFIVNYTQTSFTGAYHEAGMLVHVRTPLGAGRHCCWMVVNDDTALIYGRELLGYPKKMGAFEFDEKGDDFRASVSRHGVKIMQLEARRGSPQGPPPPMFDFKTFNVGGLGQFFMLNPIWLFRPREVIRESYQADVKLSLNDSEYDPISRLVLGSPRNGRIVVMDIPGSKYNLPVGAAGLRWFARTFKMRYR